MKYVAITLLYVWACCACKKASDPPKPPPVDEEHIPEKVSYTYLLFDSTYSYLKPDTGLGAPEQVILPFSVSKQVSLGVDSALLLAYYGTDTFIAYNKSVTRFYATKAKAFPECVRQELQISQDSMFLQRVLLDNGAYPSNCMLKGYRL